MAAPIRPTTPPGGPIPPSSSSWDHEQADGWFVFYPLERVKCPATDRRQRREGPPGDRERRGAVVAPHHVRPDRREGERPCDRTVLILSAGTICLLRIVPNGRNAASWVSPGGTFVCWKCGTVLEFQIVPVTCLLDPGLDPVARRIQTLALSSSRDAPGFRRLPPADPGKSPLTPPGG